MPAEERKSHGMSSLDTPPKRSRALVAQLKRSKIFRDYETAFGEATGLPLSLRPVEAFDLPHQGDRRENPFCALMAKTNRSCAGCLRMQQKLEEQAGLEPKTLHCFAGLCDSSVPVRVGEDVIAFLQTGQILLHTPNHAEVARTTRQLINWGVEVDLKRLEEAYFQTRVIPRRQYESVLRLIAVFAQHLASIANQLVVQTAHAEPPAVAKARAFIAERQDGEITLGEVAQAVNMSAFYFCKTFKKATGLTFTDYLARVRIEKVKSLLLNPQTRVSEAAFEAGFQSLSQFNRVFHRLSGEPPSVWRERLHARS